MAHEATRESLTAVFHDWTEALNEDYPWRMTKDEIIDHIDFHAAGGGKGLWEFF